MLTAGLLIVVGVAEFACGLVSIGGRLDHPRKLQSCCSTISCAIEVTSIFDFDAIWDRCAGGQNLSLAREGELRYRCLITWC